MHTRFIIRCSLFSAGLAFVIGCNDSGAPTGTDLAGISPNLADHAGDEEDWRAPRVEFADLEIFLEFNSTDDDLGVQVVLDAVAWDRVRAKDPNGERVLNFRAKGNIGLLGLTELRFESAEPSPAEVLGSIPPGEYHFTGRTVAGERLVGDAELSRDLPPAPVVTPGDGDVVDADNLAIRWDAIPGLAGYEVIVTNEETGADLTAVLGADATSLTVPPEMVESGSEYKVEVLAVAENGNKTITERVFRTRR